MAGIPDWSSLPDEIWGLILEKLSLEDFVRCRSICSTWSSIIGNLKQCSLQRRVPWLMIPPRDLNFSSEPMRFLDMASGKMHGIHLPELERDEILGSSDGWLILIEFETQDLKLFNPFSRAQIRLPPIPGKPSVFTVHVSTSLDCGYTVVADHDDGLSFVRTGDKTWTGIHFPERRMGHWNGTFSKGLLYLLDNNNQVVAFDLSRPGGHSDPCTLSVQVPSSKTLMDNLVVLPGSDELFLIRMSRRKIIKAFRLDQKKALKVRKFGGYSLFLTHGTCSPSYHIIGRNEVKGQIKENCVYIAEQEGLSLDVFDMEAKCITRIDKWIHCWGDPVWVTPVLLNLNRD